MDRPVGPSSLGAPAAQAPSTTSPRTTGLDKLGASVRRSVPCANDTDADNGHASLLYLGEDAPTAGSSSCDTAQRTPGNTVYVVPALPDNPTGIRQVGVATSDLDCSALISNPVIACSPDTQPGASK
jgi:hypothetical protein